MADPSTQPDELRKLEERVKTLEDTLRRFEGAAAAVKLAWTAIGVTVAAAVAGVIAFVSGYAALTRDVAHQEKAIAKLDSSIETVAKRLQAWEDKGFHHVNAVFHDAEFVALKGDKLTVRIEKNGKKMTETFAVDPGLEVRIDNRPVQISSLKLPPNAPIRVMIDPKGRVTAIDVEK